jgi:hypothetical protein
MANVAGAPAKFIPQSVKNVLAGGGDPHLIGAALGLLGGVSAWEHGADLEHVLMNMTEGGLAGHYVIPRALRGAAALANRFSGYNLSPQIGALVNEIQRAQQKRPAPAQRQTSPPQPSQPPRKHGGRAGAMTRTLKRATSRAAALR